MSPTKQAKSQGKEPKPPSGDKMEKKNLGRTHSVPLNPTHSGGPVLLWPMKEQCMIMIQAALQVRSQIASEYLS